MQRTSWKGPDLGGDRQVGVLNNGDVKMGLLWFTMVYIWFTYGLIMFDMVIYRLINMIWFAGYL